MVIKNIDVDELYGLLEERIKESLELAESIVETGEDACEISKVLLADAKVMTKTAIYLLQVINNRYNREKPNIKPKARSAPDASVKERAQAKPS